MNNTWLLIEQCMIVLLVFIISWSLWTDRFDWLTVYLFLYNLILQFGKLLKLKEDQRNLPIWQYKEQIVYAVKSNQVVIIAGDTGCGKSTQVSILIPQYFLSHIYQLN